MGKEEILHRRKRHEQTIPNTRRSRLFGLKTLLVGGHCIIVPSFISTKYIYLEILKCKFQNLKKSETKCFIANHFKLVAYTYPIFTFVFDWISVSKMNK